MKQLSKLFWLIFGVVIAVLVIHKSSNNNVCENYWDYIFIGSSKNCRRETGVYAEIPQIIFERNYTFETYHTVTEDGYILQTFRVLPKVPTKGVILLVHAFISNAEMWIDKGNHSLGFYLLERGYEIWLSNLRGSKYSNTHIKYTIKDFEYWDWSFHEQAVYDLKNQLDLINKVTKRQTTAAITYSMAGTSAIAYASLFPEHAKMSLKGFINIGGVTYVKRVQGLGVTFGKIGHFTLESLMSLGIGSLPYGSLVDGMMWFFCNSHPFKGLCILPTQYFLGKSQTEFDPLTLPIIFGKFPDGASLKSLVHYFQMYYSDGRISMYDYGVEKNLQLYKNKRPPHYPLKNINIPIIELSGSQDSFTHPEDIREFYGDLPNEAKVFGHHEIKGYNHIDLVFGRHREKDVHEPILQFLNKIEMKK